MRLIFSLRGINWRDEESFGLHRSASGGVGCGVGWGDGVGRGARFAGRGGEAADDVCRPAADEAGERSADLAVGPVGDVFSDRRGSGEELEGESSLGGAVGWWWDRSRFLRCAAE